MAKKNLKKTDIVFDVISNQIVKALENGIVPWRKTWNNEYDNALPTSWNTKKPYNGLNRLLLMATQFDCPYWLTFKQIQNLGGKVKDDETKNYQVITFWKVFENTTKAGKENKFFTLRYYRVYNLEQTEGIPANKLPKKKSKNKDFNPIILCENIVDDMPNPPKIKHGKKGAFYSYAEDKVGMPNKETFDNEQEYYVTMFHELIHSTAHKDRLERELTGGTGKDTKKYSYGLEELVAEIGSAFLAGTANISEDTIENSSAYIDGWIKAIKGDIKLVAKASKLAQKAVEYILDSE